MIAYFYQVCIRMLSGSDFRSFFIVDDEYFFTNSPYKRYTGILDNCHYGSDIIESIIEYVMSVYEYDNIFTHLTVEGYPFFIRLPKQHLHYTLKDILLNPIRLLGIPLNVNMDNENSENLRKNTNILTKNRYIKILKVLQAKIIKYAAKEAIDDYIRADDHLTDRIMNEIAIFIHSKVFNENDLRLENIMDITFIPQFYSTNDEYTVHIFEVNHIVISTGKLHISTDLSGCFIGKSISELHTDLLTTLNGLPLDDHDIIIGIKDEDDYDYIKILLDNSVNISFNAIYHKADNFKDKCVKFFINGTQNEFIKDIIYLHDKEYGLINDKYDYPPHPPESFEEIPKRIIPFLIDIAKSL